MSYISQGKNGGWYMKVVDEYHDKITEGYIQVSFKKGCEPMPEDLNEYDSLEGDFYFVHDGRKRRVFPGCYAKRDGSVGYKIIFLEEEIEEPKEESGELKIDESELPFY